MLNLDLILKNNELCLVGRPRGRVTREQAGLYVRDTRFLDQLDITLAGDVLRVLEVQTPNPHNVIITATNPEFRHGERLVRGHTILFRIDILLTSTMTCAVTVQNFGQAQVAGELKIIVGADFRDIFDVRGFTPTDPTKALPPLLDGSSATLSARGSDGVIVSTHIVASEPVNISAEPGSAHGSTISAYYPIDLPAGESTNLTIEAMPQPFGSILTDADAAGEEGGFSPRLNLTTPSQRFNAFIGQCDNDLALLQTSFPDGNIPAAGIPWYIAPFGRDSLVVALQTMHLYPIRSEQTLRLLATLQGDTYDPFREEAPGKILHEMRYGDMARTGQVPHTPYYGSIDSTPLFVMAFARHYRWHRDDALYRDLTPHVRRALAWMESDGDPDGDGLLEYGGVQIDLTHISQQGWKDSGDSLNFADGRPVIGPIALVEVQGYAYAAYAWLANAAHLHGDTSWADELAAKAEHVRQRVEDAFWMEDQQFYAQALDGEKRQVDAISSNPGHLLYCGLPSQERADAVADRLSQSDMNSGWGIRTLSENMATYNPMSYHNGSIWPHDISLTMTGLRAYGHHDFALDQAITMARVALPDPELRIAELYCGFGREHTTTGPVNYPESCLPQAWAAGAGIVSVSTLLGLDVDAEGELVVRPHLPEEWEHLDASGFRVRGRTFGVHVDRDGDGWDVKVTEM